ncbi:MAG: endonuclease domain-containing protein [Anaerolineae bacterium]
MLINGDQNKANITSQAPFSLDLLALIRRLRREQTTAEGLLWALLRDRQIMGYKFRCQQAIGPYLLDFYCVKAHLGIELDGGQHNEKVIYERDTERTAYLEALGINVVRFWNFEVLQNTESVLQELCNILFQTFTG